VSDSNEPPVPARAVILVGPERGARGGIAQFNSPLADALTARGARVGMLSFTKMYPGWTRPGRQGKAPNAQGRIDDIERALLVPWLPWTWATGARAIRRARPDIVAFQWWHPMFAPCYVTLAIAAASVGAEVTFVCHNAEPHERFPLSGVLTRAALGRSAALLVLSQGVGDTLAQRFPKRQITCLGLPPFTDFGRSDPVTEAQWRRRIDAGGRRIILFFGNVRSYKGLQDLIAAFPAVREEVPAVLVIAGTFLESRMEYEEQINRLAIGSDVRLFADYVPDPEVAALFSIADLVVLPYRSGSQSGIVPQAAHFGTPVVVTSVGSIADGVAPTNVAPPANPEALARVVVLALQHPTTVPPPSSSWETWAHAVLCLAA
jgi:glycosyltransferase involved in cell wall biosynthesis